MKVLLVEDVDQNAEEIISALVASNAGLQAELEARGASYSPLKIEDITLARSRDEALEQLKEPGVDLILLDLYIPPEGSQLPVSDVLHGFQVLERARSLTPPPDVVVISSSARKTGPGLTQFQAALQQQNFSLVPDDFLWKEDCKDPDFLQRKVAPFLVDLSVADEQLLRANDVLVPPDSIRSRIRSVLRVVKRIACSAERQRPLPDIVMRGELGSGRSVMARAFHLLRARPLDRRLGFEEIDLRSIHEGGGDVVRALSGVSGGQEWALGALPRSTYYTRSDDWVRLPGQVIEDGMNRRLMEGTANMRLYPKSSDSANFDASGTLYVDGIYDLDDLTFTQIAAILSSDLNRRFVTTRGSAPTRLHVGASIVLAGGAKYRPRLGDVVIDVPPVREMELAERLWLLEELVNLRRRRAGTPTVAVKVDSNLHDILKHELSFRNNIDDLQAIANLVLPEETSITWRHLRAAWERDRRIATPSTRAEDRTAVGRSSLPGSV